MYSEVPLYRGLIYHSIIYDTAITVAESESDIRITTDTPYLALTGELCGVHCEDCAKIDRFITAPHCISMQIENDKHQCSWDIDNLHVLIFYMQVQVTRQLVMWSLLNREAPAVHWDWGRQ